RRRRAGEAEASSNTDLKGQAGRTMAAEAPLRVIVQAETGVQEHALNRARLAVRSLPLLRPFYGEVDAGSLSSVQVGGRGDWHRLSRSHLSPTQLEDLFIWLIQLGVLRREVDGQGLTERVRLTPLGRQVLAPWPERIPPAGPVGRLRHWLLRHRPRL
ncbi:MAG: Npun_F0494 family protein, partial [Cyanobium sp.]